jgi:hypothetical protein
MKSLVALFAPASRSRTLRLGAPVTTNRPTTDRDSSRNIQSRFVSALLGALSAWSA